jgi:hypothetical protein
MAYRKSTLRTLSGSVSLDDGLLDDGLLDDGQIVGAGAHAGMVLGETEKTVIHFSTVLARQSGFAVLLTAGVGSHL